MDRIINEESRKEVILGKKNKVHPYVAITQNKQRTWKGKEQGSPRPSLL
jgi:hypothetical protein